MSDLVSAAVPEGADQVGPAAAGPGSRGRGRVTLHEVFEVLEFDDVSLDRRAEIVELLGRHGITLDESEEIAADPIADLASRARGGRRRRPRPSTRGGRGDADDEADRTEPRTTAPTALRAAPSSSSSARRRPGTTSASATAGCGPGHGARLGRRRLGRPGAGVPQGDRPGAAAHRGRGEWLAKRFEAGTAAQVQLADLEAAGAARHARVRRAPPPAGGRRATARRPSSS